MSQKDYISNNLITMRDRLRESTAAIREAAEQKKMTNLPSDTPRQDLPPADPAAAAVESAADRRMAEGFRAKQDLAGRLARDLARVNGLLARQEQQVRELAKIRESLQTLEKTLDQVTPAGSAGLFAAETDRLRLEYFRLCGTLEALTFSGESGRNKPAESRQEDTALKGAWIIGGAILAGAAVIAGITAGIFL